METVYESSFLKLDFYESQKFMEAIWLPNSVEMSEKQYQKVFMEFLMVMNQNPPRKLLIDERQMLFTVSPDLQIWVTNQVKQVLEMVLEKIALIINSELIQQLAAEQLMQEAGTYITQTRFFDGREEALEWVKNS
ncbi:MAG: hypothetical protein KTR26_20095 [Flammeovirgaceae bacterium]|nr:hypothetical protein [Flammeovirgaceae bacterium]